MRSVLYQTRTRGSTGVCSTLPGPGLCAAARRRNAYPRTTPSRCPRVVLGGPGEQRLHLRLFAGEQVAGIVGRAHDAQEAAPHVHLTLDGPIARGLLDDVEIA